MRTMSSKQLQSVCGAGLGDQWRQGYMMKASGDRMVNEHKLANPIQISPRCAELLCLGSSFVGGCVGGAAIGAVGGLPGALRGCVTGGIGALLNNCSKNGYESAIRRLQAPQGDGK